MADQKKLEVRAVLRLGVGYGKKTVWWTID
jgi:hypothetical protein